MDGDRPDWILMVNGAYDEAVVVHRADRVTGERRRERPDQGDVVGLGHGHQGDGAVTETHKFYNYFLAGNIICKIVLSFFQL